MRYVLLTVLVLTLPPGIAAEEVRRAATAKDVLGEVNAARAARGLRPFLLDEDLARGAEACAAYRARYRMEGHTANDFGFLPAGVRARAAGCAAWRPVRSPRLRSPRRCGNRYGSAAPRQPIRRQGLPTARAGCPGPAGIA